MFHKLVNFYMVIIKQILHTYTSIKALFKNYLASVYFYEPCCAFALSTSFIQKSLGSLSLPIFSISAIWQVRTATIGANWTQSTKVKFNMCHTH